MLRAVADRNLNISSIIILNIIRRNDTPISLSRPCINRNAALLFWGYYSIVTKESYAV